LQNAFWELGGVPLEHRPDRLRAAVNIWLTRVSSREPAKRGSGIHAQKTQAGQGNQNGDAEQRHYRFKRTVDQELMLRGSRDLSKRGSASCVPSKLFKGLNAGRQDRFLKR
jgi:hypothetical protein